MASTERQLPENATNRAYPTAGHSPHPRSAVPPAPYSSSGSPVATIASTHDWPLAHRSNPDPRGAAVRRRLRGCCVHEPPRCTATPRHRAHARQRHQSAGRDCRTARELRCVGRAHPHEWPRRLFPHRPRAGPLQRARAPRWLSPNARPGIRPGDAVEHRNADHGPQRAPCCTRRHQRRDQRSVPPAPRLWPDGLCRVE